MKLLALIEFLRARLKAVIAGSAAVLALIAIADVALKLAGHGPAAEAAAGAEHAHGFWASLFHYAETLPIFWSAFGFVACLLIIFLSKWYGHAGIMVREDYYDE